MLRSHVLSPRIPPEADVRGFRQDSDECRLPDRHDGHETTDADGKAG